jgi:hypothetical protein
MGGTPTNDNNDNDTQPFERRNDEKHVVFFVCVFRDFVSSSDFEDFDLAAHLLIALTSAPIRARAKHNIPTLEPWNPPSVLSQSPDPTGGRLGNLQGARAIEAF